MNRAEVTQSVLDIKTWFSRTSCYKTMKDGASTVDIQRLEKTIDTQLPFALNVLLTEVNGGIYFLEKKLYDTNEIKDNLQDLEGSKKWKQGYVPFCGDESAVLIVDSNDGDAVFEWDRDTGLGDEVAGSFVRFLENYRNDLLGGHFEFLDDVGVIEKMGAKPRK